MADHETQSNIICTDAVIVGAGFSGIAMLYRLRQLGLKAKVFEAGGDLGGTWYWNRYPGARVDSEWPFYQLSIPEIYGTFKFSERFPDHHELRRYFEHVDSVLDVKRDTYFNARVIDCRWDDGIGQWTVRTEGDHHVARCRYLMLCTGVLVRPQMPQFNGLGDFSGPIYHSSQCPENLDFRGKRVGVVGMGSTAVQLVQNIGKQAEMLTVFMRRPSYCLPSRQRPVSQSENTSWQAYMATLFEAGRSSASGFPMAGKPSKGYHNYTPEERQRHWEALWAQGGFSFNENNYHDAVTNEDANLGVYAFWASKVRARMTDPQKMDILAPMPATRAPYYIFTKRTPLEQDFYEVANQPTVQFVDLNEDPLGNFNEDGVRMAKGCRQIDLDVVILATGFDAFSGAVTHTGLKSRYGVDLGRHWSNGIRTYLGMTLEGFPNAFMAFTPHAPTVFSNGVTIIEMQCDFACSVIKKIEASGGNHGRKIKSVEATAAAEDEWVEYISAQGANTLLSQTSSWWNAANGPNRKSQMLTYIYGIANYEKECLGRLDGWQGFDVRYWDVEPSQVSI